MNTFWTPIESELPPIDNRLRDNIWKYSIPVFISDGNYITESEYSYTGSNWVGFNLLPAPPKYWCRKTDILP